MQGSRCGGRILVGTYVAVRDAAGLGVRDERGNEERAGPWRLRGSRKSHVFALALNSLALDQVDATQVLDGRAGLACRTSASSPTPPGRRTPMPRRQSLALRQFLSHEPIVAEGTAPPSPPEARKEGMLWNVSRRSTCDGVRRGRWSLTTSARSSDSSRSARR
jgi:hypothetical protein